ncbi:MAG: translation initiation factor, partial [Planctomycetaceae bacterium]|nr:translation initiation factor [Planctomycetaceae bacterium]
MCETGKRFNPMRLFAGTQWDREPQCDRCGQPEPQCKCHPLPAAATTTPPNQQTARLSMEKRKKGKLVTVIKGLPATGNDLPALLSKLKTSLGAGGTIEGDEVEIQGEHLDRVRLLLSQMGYKVKG